MDKFKRRVRIKKHFAVQPTDTSLDNSIETLLHLRINKTLTLTEAKTSFNPDIFRCPLENYLNDISNKIAVIQTLDSLKPCKEHKKWTLFNDIAKKLRERKDIVIKKYDQVFIFSTAIFLLLNLGVIEYINKFVDTKKIKKMVTFQ